MLSQTARLSLRHNAARAPRRSGLRVVSMEKGYATDPKDSTNAKSSGSPRGDKTGPIRNDPRQAGFQPAKGGFNASSNTGYSNTRRTPDLTNAAQGYSGRTNRTQQSGFQSSGNPASGDRSSSEQKYGGDRRQGGFVQRDPASRSQQSGQGNRFGSQSTNYNNRNNTGTGGSESNSNQGRQDSASFQPRRYDQRPNQGQRNNMQQSAGNVSATATTSNAAQPNRPKSQFFESAPTNVIVDAADADADVDVDIDDGLPDTQGKQRTKADSAAIKKRILAKHALAKRKKSAAARDGAVGKASGRPGGPVVETPDVESDVPGRLPGLAARGFPESKKGEEDEPVELDLEGVEEETEAVATPEKDLFNPETDKVLARDARRGLIRSGADDKDMNDFILGGADALELREMERQAILQDAQMEKLKNPSVDLDSAGTDDLDGAAWADELGEAEEDAEVEESAADEIDIDAEDDDAPAVVVSSDNPYTKDWLPDGSEVTLPEDTEPDRPFLDSNQDAFLATAKQDLADMEDFSSMLDEFEQVEDGERKAVGRYIASLDSVATYFDDLLFKYQRRAYQQARSRKRWQKFMKQVREKAEATKGARLEKRLKRKEAEKILASQQFQGLRTGDWFYYKALKMWVRRGDLENPMIRSTIATIVDNATYDLQSKQRAVKLVMNMVAYIDNPPKEDVEHANWVYSMPKKKAADPRETEHLGRIPDMDWNKLISDAERSISFDDMKEKYTISPSQTTTKPLIHETFRESSD